MDLPRLVSVCIGLGMNLGYLAMWECKRQILSELKSLKRTYLALQTH